MIRNILIDGSTFYVSDGLGNETADTSGLYHRDMRHLSAFDVQIDGISFYHLGEELHGSNRRTIVASTVGSAVNSVEDAHVPKQASQRLHVDQTVTEAGGITHAIELTNYASPFTGELSVTFDADFADVFEVRGLRASFQRDIVADVSDDQVTYHYEYLDGNGQSRSRATTVAFGVQPDSLRDGSATFAIDLDLGESISFAVTIRPALGGDGETRTVETRTEMANGGTGSTLEIPDLETGSDAFDQLFERASVDLDALTTETAYGLVPLAGAPWFATVFGRDSIITAFQTLAVAPSIARGTLRYLAAKRGTGSDEAREEAPGKIFHEIRHGELAHRELIPHRPYYGTVDATPLWIGLLGQLWRWTGDDAIARELSVPLDGALGWIDAATSRHGNDPFLYYDCSPDVGLRHKAWRDTPGSVQLPDGRQADPPIASVEVQGYVYRALLEAATLFDGPLSDTSRAAALREKANELGAAFEEEFWVDETSFYAMAKDGHGDIVPTRSSNVGHCLWSEIVPDHRAETVADVLLSDELFTGWGIRTVGRSAKGYNPISYHLGSVWPHDTSLIALGLAKYGYYERTETLARGLLEACVHFDNQRIPELFCGFDDELSPMTYPASCVPQAWSAAAPYAVMQALFGFDPTRTAEATNTPEIFSHDAIEPVRKTWL